MARHHREAVEGKNGQGGGYRLDSHVLYRSWGWVEECPSQGAVVKKKGSWGCGY